MTATTYRVLFVDDEPNILSGLRRMLRAKRDWDLTFADGTEQALEQMAVQPVDVVVSDMRMPGMDGGQLLAQVRVLYPSTARLILSGHADREAIISAVGPTQQFLAKPCDADTLVRAITRVLAVRDLVTDERLRAILGDVEALPKPPAVHEQMIEVSSRPNSRLADVVAVIESDLALCAEILKLVNSAFFGLSGHVDSVERAASLLGLDTIHALAVSGKVFGVGASTPPELDLAELRTNGMRAGGFARAVAASEAWPRDTVSQAFLTALLRDVGLLVLVASSPDGYRRMCEVPAARVWERRDAELAAFGCTVAEASAYILGLWGFSEPVIQAMASQPASPGDRNATPLAHVVSFAHRRAVMAEVPSEPDSDPWLDDERLSRWNAVAAGLRDAPTED
jgi:HD-like signal output (HDOD) protein/CheY-like chemotaxis protein